MLGYLATALVTLSQHLANPRQERLGDRIDYAIIMRIEIDAEL